MSCALLSLGGYLSLRAMSDESPIGNKCWTDPDAVRHVGVVAERNGGPERKASPMANTYNGGTSARIPTHAAYRASAMFRSSGRTDGYAKLAEQEADRRAARAAAKAPTMTEVKAIRSAMRTADPRQRVDAIATVQRRIDARERFLANANRLKGSGPAF